MYYKNRTHAMGTSIEIILDGPHEKSSLADIQECFTIFHDFEQEFSRFLPGSELSLLNAELSRKVSERFKEVFHLSKRMYQETGGYFNPCVNVSGLGYNQSFENLSQGGRTSSGGSRETGDFEGILLNEGGKLMLPPKTSLDFGGIVKGFCAEKVKEYLLSQGYTNFLVNAGGDICIEQEDDAPKTLISIENPYQAGRSIASIQLQKGSLTTSGVYRRNWISDDMMYHHIITPERGDNSYDIHSLTLVGDSVAQGDAIATALVAMGAEKARDYINSHDLKVIVFYTSGEIDLSPAFKKEDFNFTLLHS